MKRLTKLNIARSSSIPDRPGTWERALFLALALLALAIPHANAQTPAKRLNFESYRMVRVRNIFDPERQGNATIVSPPPTTPTTRSDYAALTGILVTAEKSLAFFSGSRPEFNKVLSLSGTIAGATISKITESNIEVERNGKPVRIAIGQTVPLNAAALPGPVPLDAAPPAGSTTSGTSTTPGPTSERDAVLRRMMERRQRELK